jgi:hypothetical protein
VKKVFNVESLESREMLSCLVVDRGRTILINTDADDFETPNEVWVEEEANSDITVVCYARDTIDATFEQTFSNVRTVIVRGTPGDDFVLFDLLGLTPLRINVSTFDGYDSVGVGVEELFEPLTISVNLGNDDDDFYMGIVGDIVGNLFVNVNAGAGDDWVEYALFNGIYGGRTRLTTSLGTGDDGLDIFISTIDSSSTPLIRVSGGGGNDALWIDDILEERSRLTASQFESVFVNTLCEDQGTCV